MRTKGNTSLVVTLLALAGVLSVLVACGTSQSPTTPGWVDGMNATVRGTVDVAAADAMSTLIWMDAQSTAQARAEQASREQTRVALEAIVTADARKTEMSVSVQQTAQATAAIATAAQAAELTRVANVHASETAAAAASATAVMSSTRSALAWAQTVEAATVIASSTAQSAQATAVATQHRIEQENNTAFMWTLLTWAGGLIGVVVAGLAVYAGVRAFMNWEQRRHAVDLGNGQSVWYEDVEEVLPDGRRVKRRVLIDPQRMLGPVVDVSMKPAVPSEGAQERTAARALFTSGWVESARAQAAGQALAAEASGNGRGPRAAAATPALPAGGEVYLTPVDQADRPQVIVIERPEDVRQLIPPAQLTAIDADWIDVDGEGGNDDDD